MIFRNFLVKIKICIFLELAYFVYMQTKSANNNLYPTRDETRDNSVIFTGETVINPSVDAAQLSGQDGSGPKQKGLIEILSNSQLYHEFSDAFNKAFGLPITLRPVELWRLPLHNVKMENAFCALIAEKSSTCSICLQVQKNLADLSVTTPKTVQCPFGMFDSAVPIKTGDTLIGYLQTGQVFLRKPEKSQFLKVLKLLKNHKYLVDEEKVKEVYYSSPVLSPTQYEAVITMLNIFSKQLVILSNQLIIMQGNAEPVIIKKAKEYIQSHQTEELSLEDVAKHVNTSVYYFCKVFKKYTGLNFTDYVSRLRIERAKNLLLNPNIKICDIAYEVGFQSLTHFNRVFKKITGLSPTEYRGRLPLG